jgi:predicted hydrocarbon binding protein
MVHTHIRMDTTPHEGIGMTTRYDNEIKQCFGSVGATSADLLPETSPESRENLMKAIDGLMLLNGNIIKSLEEIAGRGANAIAYRAGKKSGHETAKDQHKGVTVEEALHDISVLLEGQYTFDLWKPGESEDFVLREDGSSFSYLVFHDCIVRKTLKRTCQEPGGPLCQTVCGYVIGAVEEMTGKRGMMEILHTGADSCIKKLTLK